MEFSKLVEKRRSIRGFSKKEIHWNVLADILDAGRWAPNAGNAQNFRFVVVRDDDKRGRIMKACYNQDWMVEAPVFIVICSDMNRIKTLYGKSAEKFSVENCAAAMQNMLLCVSDLGLGGVWIGAFNESRVNAVISGGDKVIVQSVLCLGYPKGRVRKGERRPLADMVFFEKYGERVRGETKVLPLAKPVARMKKKLFGK